MRASCSLIAVTTVLGSVFVAGCANSSSSPTSPSSSVGGASATAAAVSGPPEYERAYYNGAIVTMNHISVPQNPQALAHAAADLYAVFYPANHALWPVGVLPLCNPCDHPGPAGDPRN